MRVFINGEARELADGITLADLLKELKLEAKILVVELNRHIIDRGDYAVTQLKADDHLEIVHFVGGG